MRTIRYLLLIFVVLIQAGCSKKVVPQSMAITERSPEFIEASDSMTEALDCLIEAGRNAQILNKLAQSGPIKLAAYFKNGVVGSHGFLADDLTPILHSSLTRLTAINAFEGISGNGNITTDSILFKGTLVAIEDSRRATAGGEVIEVSNQKTLQHRTVVAVFELVRAKDGKVLMPASQLRASIRRTRKGVNLFLSSSSDGNILRAGLELTVNESVQVALNAMSTYYVAKWLASTYRKNGIPSDCRDPSKALWFAAEETREKHPLIVEAKAFVVDNVAPSNPSKVCFLITAKDQPTKFEQLLIEISVFVSNEFRREPIWIQLDSNALSSSVPHCTKRLIAAQDSVVIRVYDKGSKRLLGRGLVPARFN